MPTVCPHTRCLAAVAAVCLLALVDAPAEEEAPEPAHDQIEQRAFELVNAQRAKDDVAELEFAPDLLTVARAHSARMAEEGFFDHKDPDGNGPTERIERAGIRWRALAENIATASRTPDPADFAVRGWIRSEGHLRNLMNPAYDETAVGVARSEKGRYYFTQVFLKRAR